MADREFMPGFSVHGSLCVCGAYIRALDDGPWEHQQAKYDDQPCEPRPATWETLSPAPEVQEGPNG